MFVWKKIFLRIFDTEKDYKIIYTVQYYSIHVRSRIVEKLFTIPPLYEIIFSFKSIFNTSSSSQDIPPYRDKTNYTNITYNNIQNILTKKRKEGDKSRVFFAIESRTKKSSLDLTIVALLRETTIRKPGRCKCIERFYPRYLIMHSESEQQGSREITRGIRINSN